ncbi:MULTISPECIES: hypothetical protein [Cohnella]|uniref:hypothetical protein n=1 Tax=Cohnella TaxID=329857 RepID=UPI0009BBA75F|nr:MULTISPECIES: hypothetical protein [Cohnella]MBN2984923.1 hypothetical protein [Cohnella algarum]
MKSEQLASAPEEGVVPAQRRASKPSFIPFLILWVVLIGGGIAGSVWYTGYLKQQVAQDLERQTAAQIAALQSEYLNRLEQLETSYAAEMDKLSAKVDTLNELLTFTQDNANDRTDNSNQLYTQISELKKQLDQLKKNLDVLK